MTRGSNPNGSMKDILKFIQLSRPINLLITLISLGLAAFLAREQTIDFLGTWTFWLPAMSIVAITGTGYWVNDAFDFKIDMINKPEKTIVGAHLSRKKVLTAYFSALGCIALFSVLTLPWELWPLNVGAAALLWLYAWLFKRISVVGNVMIASLTALVILYAGIMYWSFPLPLIWTLVFAFEITFIREVTKDIEDIRGDLRFRLNTLPIRIGIRNTKKILYVAYGVFFLTCWVPVLAEYLILGTFNWQYALLSLLIVQLPCVYLIYKLSKSYRPEDFGRQSSLIKYLIFTGIITIFLLH